MRPDKQIVPPKLLNLVSGLVKFIDETDEAYAEKNSERTEVK